jgi:hypothetical protein
MKLKIAILCFSASLTMRAQFSLVANSSLKEIPVFVSGSDQFTMVVNNLGANSSLLSLGPLAGLFAAIRNDSPQTIESMRILFEIETNGSNVENVVIDPAALPSGATRIIAPPGLSSVASAMTHAASGAAAALSSTAQGEFAIYEGKRVLVSIDSASTVSGQFLGPDKLNYFTNLVQGDLDKAAFLDDILKLMGSPLDDVKQWLNARRTAARGRSHGPGVGFKGLNLAAMDEARDCLTALGQLNSGGVAGLMSWAEQRKNLLMSRPVLHR